MLISNILDLFYSKEPASKQLDGVDISDFPYKTEQDFSDWLKTKFGATYLEPETIARRLSVARSSREEEFKFSAGADDYLNKADKSTLLGLETITYDVNSQGRKLLGEMPLNMESKSAQSLLRARIKRQLANVGYDADKTAKSQLALAELRKHGYLTPKFIQTIEIGAFIDDEMQTMNVLGEITKVTYIVDIKNPKFTKALAKIMASQYTGEKVAELELVDA